MFGSKPVSNNMTMDADLSPLGGKKGGRKKKRKRNGSVEMCNRTAVATAAV
jgi:hypothetical protein